MTPMDASASPGQAMLLVGSAAVLGLSAVLTFPVSSLLLALYRRRVVAHMSRGAAPAPETSHERPAGSSAPPDTADRLAVEVVEANAGSGPGEGDPAFQFVIRACRRAAAVYAVAGSASTVVMAGASLWMSTSDLDGFWWQLNPFVVAPAVLEQVLIFGWLTLLTVVIAAASARRRRLQVTAAFAVALGALMLYRAAFGGFFVDSLWPGLIVNVLPALLVLATLHRRVRAAAPVVLVFLCVYCAAVCAVAYVFLFVTPWPRLPLLPSDPGAVTLQALWFGLITLLGASALTPVGWWLGRRVGARFANKRSSEQAIFLDALWLFYSFSQGPMFVLAMGPLGLAVPAAAFAVYKTITVAGFARVLRTPPPVTLGRRLLILRPFSLGRRSERLLDSIGKKWRYLGSVHVICGPDLARSTVAPHEFLDFLRGRLARRFIDGPAALDARMADKDLGRDPDGRFRVNVYFCRDDMWRPAFVRLAADADVILVDLRGFGRQHEGLGYEIRHLVRTVPLGRVVGLIDDTTDRGALAAVARQGFAEREADGPDQRGLGDTTLRLVSMLGQDLQPPRREPLWSLCRASAVGAP